ncbi:VOC family protein [Streptomyces griseus]|uniref:VOC family protein n=1 Tax=Streptomyces griseus TaxID=1911 RepID=UPI0031BB98A4
MEPPVRLALVRRALRPHRRNAEDTARQPHYSWSIVSDLLGINHLTLSTTDLDRLVAYYTELLGATLAFERAATSSHPRIAAVDVGGNDHLMIVETAEAPTTDPDPLGNAGWGLRVGTYARLSAVRESILGAGWPVGQIETLPAQWTMTARDPDGRPVDVRAHRPVPPDSTSRRPADPGGSSR